MHRFFGLINIGLLLFDVVCIIVSISIDYWAYFDNDKQNIHAGIWNLCEETKLTFNSTCSSVDGSGDYVAVRAMLIISLLLVIGAIVCIAIKLFALKYKTIILFITAGILCIAGLFLMIGFAVYRSKVFESVKDDYPNVAPHAGFALCVIAWLVTWTAAGVTILMCFVEKFD